MSDKEKTKIAPPVGGEIDVVAFNGMLLPIVADLREAHAISFSKRHDAGTFGPPIPSVEVLPGAMVVVLPTDVAEHIRGMIREAKRNNQQKSGIGPGTASIKLAEFPH